MHPDPVLPCGAPADQMDAIYSLPITGDGHLHLFFSSPDLLQRTWPSPWSLPPESFVFDELDSFHSETGPRHGRLETDAMTVVSEPEISNHADRIVLPPECQPQVSQVNSTRENHAGNASRTFAGMQTKFSVGRKVYVTPQTTSIWESHKSELRRLYIDEDKTLKDIMCIMDARGFGARYVTMPSRHVLFPGAVLTSAHRIQCQDVQDEV
jgi:hypothetical protein